MTTQVDDVPHKGRRGWSLTRSGNRDEQRDAVMRKIFAKPGFAAEVARRLDVTHQNVSGWNRVPAHHVMDVAKILRMAPSAIRPDIFGRRRK